MKSEYEKKVDFFTLKTSKNHLFRIFVRNERVRVKKFLLCRIWIFRTESFLCWNFHLNRKGDLKMT